MTAAMCLAIAMFFEARGEGVTGMRAVGEVVVNRYENDRFPNDICDVVFDGCQFSFNCDGKPENMYTFDEPKDVQSRKLAKTLAQEILDGERILPETVTFFHTTGIKPHWSEHPDFALEGKIGNHLFYSCKNYC